MDKHTRAVFFDLDDTLYDQLLPFARAIKQESLDIGTNNIEEIFKSSRKASDLLWEEYKKGNLSLDGLRRERLIRSFREYGITLTRSQASGIQESYEKYQGEISLFPSVKKAVKLLKDNHIICGIITNGPVQHQKRKIEALKLSELISDEYIFVSDGIGFAKPDKNIFSYVSKRINIPANQSVYIGDSWENDVVPAYEAGWTPVWYNYRHRKGGTGKEPEIIDDYGRLISYLKEKIS
ncbi:HAD family hydrolase [Alkalihalophilus lindianensis]|uniref:HAD family hydrolase n=1 Tax=Alkalihalophilus lindianensis TaxID=1630542 RepID=A0ABU3XCM4_9BACI|nr:HAD family hydrolase [Alkalihalophilus lindianensis]MDV2685639.1 HAD family hydrolase [Alkalihalophilus lindianensis]